jgi:Fe(II)/alpha-ketoglutarate-dependent arginine beta-hydroxylase
VITYRLSPDEIRGIDEVIEGVVEHAAPAHHPAVLRAAALSVADLPRSLRAALLQFRWEEPAGALLVSGFPIDDDRIGPTPGHWRQPPADCPLTREEAYLLLLSTLLGEPFGWSTQQDGRLVHNVLPIRGHETEQLGSSSAEPLWWHTEDAFHRFRPDYVDLLCLRNPDAAVTRYADVSRLPIAGPDRRLLSEPGYTIRPDNSHRAQHNSGSGNDPRRTAALAAVEQAYAEPEPIAVLSGDLADPYVRLDPYFMDPPPDPRHAAALDRLRALVHAALVDVVLAPGDCLILDNYRAVHGRAPFRAKFDGRDRWLKRLCVTRDLRRSRAARPSLTGRLIDG